MNEHADPGEVARGYFAALADARWRDAAAYTDPVAAAEFKAAAIRDATEEETRREEQRRSAAEDPRMITTFPEVPRYCVRYRVESIDELRALDPIDLLARMPPREDAVPAGGPHSNRRLTKREVIGHVVESDDTAHVVYRWTVRVGERDHAMAMVLELRRSGGEWRALGSSHFMHFSGGWEGYTPAES